MDVCACTIVHVCLGQGENMAGLCESPLRLDSQMVARLVLQGWGVNVVPNKLCCSAAFLVPRIVCGYVIPGGEPRDQSLFQKISGLLL